MAHQEGEEGLPGRPAGHKRRRNASPSSTWRTMSTRVYESSSWDSERVSPRRHAQCHIHVGFERGEFSSPSVTGTLKGFDQLMNLVMDDVTEEYEGVFTLCSVRRYTDRRRPPTAESRFGRVARTKYHVDQPNRRLFRSVDLRDSSHGRADVAEIANPFS